MTMPDNDFLDFGNTRLALVETLFERTSIGVAIFNREYALVRCNPTWAEFIDQYTPSKVEDVIPGKSMFELAPGAEEFILPVFERVLKGETVRLDALRSVSGEIESFWDAVFHPIYDGDEIIGILDITTDATERVQALHTLEQRVDERTEEIERRRKVAESLGDILQAINSEKPLPEVLAHIVETASSLMGAQACVLHHVDEAQQFVSNEASFGLPEKLRNIPGFPLFSSQKADERIMERTPIWVEDFHKQPAPEDQSGNENIRLWRELTGKAYRAWLAVPLVIGEQVYGSLAFYFAQPQAFTREMIDLGTSFANQTSLALENAHLRGQAEENAALAERSRLARDLHDAVTQTLFSASLIAEVLPKIWERDIEAGRQRLEELRQLTRGALSEMRTLLMELRPAALLETPLPDLLQHLVNAFLARTRIPIDYHREGNADLPGTVKEALYRIAQEALNNIAKHAGASQVELSLVLDPESARLAIRDDGCGFDPQAVSAGRLGLGIMQERAASVGADLAIESHVNGGTCINVTWKGISS